MARPTFRYDLLASLFAAMGMGTVLPQLAGQFVRRGLHGSAWLVGLLVSLTTLGHLLGTFFARDLSRKPGVPMAVAGWIGMALFLACMALLPAEPGIAGSFAALLVVPYLLAAIILNVQSAVRHSNYPAEVRGRIFSRLTVAVMAATATSATLAGYAMDRLPWGHRLVYALAAGATIFSAYFYSKIRVRRERTLLRAGRARPASLLTGFRVLKEDRLYGRFLLWQAVSGTSALMSIPVMALVMTDYLNVGYGKGTTALTLTPLAVMICAAPLTGRLFDHVRITRFRSVGAGFWALSQLIIFLAVLKGSWPAVLVGFAVQGLGRSMGHIAFNLGHMHFTSPGRSADYMGIHLTLMGIRGFLAPMLGAALLKLPGVGLGVLVIAAAMHLVAAGGFLLMPPPATPLTEATAGCE